ncbi:MAG: hypothetical protein AAF264_03395 [Pseudomonadota bacterium]
MDRRRTKVLQNTIARALRAARDADLDVASFVISEETGEVKIFTDLGVAPAPMTDIDAAVDNWK